MSWEQDFKIAYKPGYRVGYHPLPLEDGSWDGWYQHSAIVLFVHRRGETRIQTYHACMFYIVIWHCSSLWKGQLPIPVGYLSWHIMYAWYDTYESKWGFFFPSFLSFSFYTLVFFISLVMCRTCLRLWWRTDKNRVPSHGLSFFSLPAQRYLAGSREWKRSQFSHPCSIVYFVDVPVLFCVVRLCCSWYLMTRRKEKSRTSIKRMSYYTKE